MIICSDQRTGQGCGAANADTARYCVYCGQALRYGLPIHNPGSQVGAYKVVRVLGHGMFGAVYEAEALERPGERAAIKATIDPASAGGFRQEFAALHQLRHPGLPRYYELFEQGGNAYLVMELVPGQSLEERLAKRPHGLDERELLDIARQLCAVLAYLHGRRPPILHRDIKPANIRRTPSGVVKLVDFGLLKHGGAQTRLTIRGVGTPAYAPLEQYGGGLTDPRSDIYSLGATLYHLLSGREPPPATERVAATADPLQPPHRLNPAISRRTSEAVLRAMALSQGQRWPSAEAFNQALGTASGSPIVEGLRELWERWRQTRARQRRQRYQLAGHGGGAWCAAYSPDGQTLASGGADLALRLWRVADGEELRVLRGHRADVTCLAWRPDGQALASGAADGTILVWGVSDDGGLLHELRGHSAGVLGLAWHPASAMLASVGRDGMVLLWRLDPDAGTPAPEELGRHSRMALSVSFSPDGSSLASVGADGRVQVWWP